MSVKDRSDSAAFMSRFGPAPLQCACGRQRVAKNLALDVANVFHWSWAPCACGEPERHARGASPQTRRALALEAGTKASAALLALEESLGPPAAGLRPSVYQLRSDLALLRERVGNCFSEDLSDLFDPTTKDGRG